MRVLITGALGFIGSHLADAYTARGDEVWGIDDRSGNVVDSLPGRLNGVHVITADVRDLMREWSSCLGRGTSRPVPDLIVHAASPVGPVALLKRSSIVAEVIETTQAVIRYCERYDVPLVNIASSEVYGFSGVYRETDDCVVSHRLSHRLQYAAGKLAAEQLVRTSNLRAVSIRPFNIAGPRQSREKGFVIPTFCEQAAAGEPLTVFDGGDQERCPTAVWDICDLILRLDLREHAGLVVNAGNPQNRTTIRMLAELVQEVAGTGSPIKQTCGKAIHGSAYEEAVGRVKVPNITLASSLGWRPRFGLREMVQRTLEEVTDAAPIQAGRVVLEPS